MLRHFLSASRDKQRDRACCRWVGGWMRMPGKETRSVDTGNGTNGGNVSEGKGNPSSSDSEELYERLCRFAGRGLLSCELAGLVDMVSNKDRCHTYMLVTRRVKMRHPRLRHLNLPSGSVDRYVLPAVCTDYSCTRRADYALTVSVLFSGFQSKRIRTSTLWHDMTSRLSSSCLSAITYAYLCHPARATGEATPQR